MKENHIRREEVLLRYCSGVRVTDIAASMGMSRQNVNRICASLAGQRRIREIRQRMEDAVVAMAAAHQVIVIEEILARREQHRGRGNV